ncbi:hypothetical protein C4K35_1889 [Pseudomonas chlororaphis subsp. piscium]|uniref:hypothetical protein n=1 Tax=Pseudomonas chlororaphis TaxID=587753 RepID=UPI000F5683C1|nr:hypothetical protein [Pseudomonas chlororaphis]AZC49482.1 hypothetical protein C4K35_1889 [Pseudomonas chlororaphis subsp. piscium]
MNERLIELLKELHSDLAEQLLADLHSEEKRGPQLYNQIIKFLKDNGIDALPKGGNPVQSLLDGLSEFEDEVNEAAGMHKH